jgi:PAS domain S-box-containing protein
LNGNDERGVHARRGFLQIIPHAAPVNQTDEAVDRALLRRASSMSIASSQIQLTGVERVLADDAIIVSKTDPQGRITYANDTFLMIADYTESEILGAPHAILRHPAMPRSVFALLWQRIEQGKEVYAVVLNRSKHGDHYWVHAHVTPSLGADGSIRGHHSFRRKARRSSIDEADKLYRDVLAIEAREFTKADQVRAGLDAMRAAFGDIDRSYDRWSWKAAP